MNQSQETEQWPERKEKWEWVARKKFHTVDPNNASWRWNEVRAKPSTRFRIRRDFSKGHQHPGWISSKITMDWRLNRKIGINMDYPQPQKAKLEWKSEDKEKDWAEPGSILTYENKTERSRDEDRCRDDFRAKSRKIKGVPVQQLFFLTTSWMATLTSTHVTWQDGVKYTQDQNTSAEGLLFDIPKQGCAKPFKDVVHIKKATKNLEYNRDIVTILMDWYKERQWLFFLQRKIDMWPLD